MLTLNQSEWFSPLFAVSVIFFLRIWLPSHSYSVNYRCVGKWNLVSWPRIELRPPALGTQVLALVMKSLLPVFLFFFEIFYLFVPGWGLSHSLSSGMQDLWLKLYGLSSCSVQAVECGSLIAHRLSSLADEPMSPTASKSVNCSVLSDSFTTLTGSLTGAVAWQGLAADGFLCS